jgi:cytoskeletal protein RodZ
VNEVKATTKEKKRKEKKRKEKKKEKKRKEKKRKWQKGEKLAVNPWFSGIFTWFFGVALVVVPAAVVAVAVVVVLNMASVGTSPTTPVEPSGGRSSGEVGKSIGLESVASRTSSATSFSIDDDDDDEDFRYQHTLTRPQPGTAVSTTLLTSIQYCCVARHTRAFAWTNGQTNDIEEGQCQ